MEVSVDEAETFSAVYLLISLYTKAMQTRWVYMFRKLL